MIKGEHLHFVFNYSWAAIAHELGHLWGLSPLKLRHSLMHTWTHTLAYPGTWPGVFNQTCSSPLSVCTAVRRSLQVHVGVIRLCCCSGWGSNALIRLPRSAKAQTVTLTVWFISMETRENLWSNYPYCCHLRHEETTGWHEYSERSKWGRGKGRHIDVVKRVIVEDGGDIQ